MNESNVPQWISDWANGLHDGQVVPCNGGYYLSAREYEIFIPQTVNENTNMTIYRYGAGGFDDDSTIAIEYVQNNPLDQITIFPKYEDSYDTVYKEVIGIIDKNTVANVNNITDIGYSCNYKDSIDGIIQNIENNPNLPSQTIVCLDGKNAGDGGESYGLQYLSYLISENPEKIKALAENGTKIVAYERQSEIVDGTKTLGVLKELSMYGVDVTVVAGTEDHGKQRDYAIQSGLLSMTSGDFSNSENLGEYGYKVYSIENGNMQEASYSDLQEKFGICGQLSDNDTGSQNDEKENLENESDDSKDKNQNNESTNHNDTISVEYSFVESNLDSLLSINKSCNILSVKNVTNNTGGSSTFTIANEYFNNYADTSKNFLVELNNAYNGILNMAKSMYNLDANLANSIGIFGNNKQLKAVLNIDLKGINDFYDKLPVINADFSSLGGNIKITSEMLRNALSDKNIIVSSINQDIEDTKKIKAELTKFIDSSGSVLKGRAWNKVRGKLNEYIEVCDKKCNYAQSLLESMKNAYTDLLDYLEDYDELDTAKLPEVKARISEVQTKLANLEQQLASLEHIHGQPIYGEDWKGNKIIIGYVDKSAEIAATKNQIAILQEVLIMLIDWRNKLEGLPSKDSSTANKLTSTGSSSQALGGSSALGSGLGGVNLGTPGTGISNSVNNIPNNPVVGGVNNLSSSGSKPSSPGQNNSYINNTSNNNNSYYDNLTNNQPKEDIIINKEEQTSQEILNNNQPIIDDKEIIDNDTQNVESEKPSISDTPQTPPISTPKKDKSALKTIGKILGIGGATAAVG
ncbi:MAG: hypothetical protein IJZ79_03815, partial [Bacilli bacterium]|nr:hypothetical protein [Bacilli bacterium]